MVKMAKPKCITLAIGDGANDVSMITEVINRKINLLGICWCWNLRGGRIISS